MYDVQSHAYRAMGWLIRFIKDRDMSTENIARSVSRMNYIRALPHQLIDRVITRLTSHKALNKRSLFKPISEAAGHDRPGSFSVVVRHSERNTKWCRVSQGSRLRAAIVSHFVSLSKSRRNILWKKIATMSAGTM